MGLNLLGKSVFSFLIFDIDLLCDFAFKLHLIFDLSGHSNSVFVHAASIIMVKVL